MDMGQASHRGANRPEGNRKKYRTNAVQLSPSRTFAAGRMDSGSRALSMSHAVSKAIRKYDVKHAIGEVQLRQPTRAATPNQIVVVATVRTNPIAAYPDAVSPIDRKRV